MIARAFALFSSLMIGCSLFPPRSANDIDDLAEKVLEKKEGIDILLMPIDPKKPTKSQ